MKDPAFDSKISRRKFVALAGAALAMPAFIPGRALGLDDTTAPSKRINLGVIGCGNQGTRNTHSFLALKDCQVVAACDLDKHHLTHFANIVNEHYQNKDCKAYHDYRELLARTDIDAVMIAVPDHWHELVATRSRAAQEGHLRRKAAGQDHRRAAGHRPGGGEKQNASGRRVRGSVPCANFHKAAEIVRNGLIGKVTRVEVGLPARTAMECRGKETPTSMTPSDRSRRQNWITTPGSARPR